MAEIYDPKLQMYDTDLYGSQYQMGSRVFPYGTPYGMQPAPQQSQGVLVPVTGQEDMKERSQQEKRLRRLMKNRESAQLSRERKKIYLDKLEKQADYTNRENTDLRAKVSTLRSENRLLKDHIKCLKNVVHQATTLSVILNTLHGTKGEKNGDIDEDLMNSIKKLSNDVGKLAGGAVDDVEEGDGSVDVVNPIIKQEKV